MTLNTRDKHAEHKEGLMLFLKEETKRISEDLSKTHRYDFLEAVEQLEVERAAFISQSRRLPIDCETFFVILRKWNSYTPSLPIGSSKMGSMNQYSIGGGYFLYVQGEESRLSPGYGLVIDPGYNFIHNFGQAGFCLDDIDGIFITHAHNDHTNDFESLLSLLFQRNGKYIERRKPKKVDLFLNVGSFKKFSNYLDLANNKNNRNYIGKVTVMSPGQVIKIPDREDLSLEMLTLYTKHHEIVTADYSLGVCFKVSDRNILLTGDTAWDFDLAQKNEEFLEENGVHTRGEYTSNIIDVLIAHIGTIKKTEFEGKSKEGLDYYDKHLGILGVISTIEQWKPDLCVISEFGEELNDIRASMVTSLEVTAKKLYADIRCLPGDVGLFLLLDSKKAMCFYTGEPVEWKKLLYKDIEEKDRQKAIKYYAEGSIPNHVDEDELLELLKTMRPNNGFRKFKAIYLESLKESFALQSLKKADLLKELSEMTIDYTEPTTIEIKKLEVIGRLTALSCVIDNPTELLDALVNGNNVDEIGAVLSNYHFDTRFKEYNNEKCIDIDLINAFSLFCRKHGYGEQQSSITAEESVFQDYCKDLVKQFVNNMKNKEYGKAYKIIDKLNMLTIANIWNEIMDKQKIDILLHNQGDPKDITLSGPEEELCKYIKAYFTYKNNLLNEKTRSLEKMLATEMCREGLISLYSMSAEHFSEELSHTIDPDKRSILDQVINALRKMTDFDKEIETIIVDPKIRTIV